MIIFIKIHLKFDFSHSISFICHRYLYPLGVRRKICIDHPYA